MLVSSRCECGATRVLSRARHGFKTDTVVAATEEALRLGERDPLYENTKTGNGPAAQDDRALFELLIPRRLPGGTFLDHSAAQARALSQSL